MATEVPLAVAPEPATLFADKSKMFLVEPEAGLGFMSTCAISVTASRLYKIEQVDVFVTCVSAAAQKPRKVRMPCVVRFSTQGDFIACAVKQTANGSYFFGIPVAALGEWTPPRSARDEVDEDRLFLLHKLPHPDITEIRELDAEDADDAVLRNLVDRLLSCAPSFKNSKLKSIKDIEKFNDKPFEVCCTVAVEAGEIKERKAAAEKARVARSAAESAGGGQEAKEKWAKLKAEILALKSRAFNILTFEQRFLTLEVEGDECIPTAQAIEEFNASLE